MDGGVSTFVVGILVLVVRSRVQIEVLDDVLDVSN